MINETLPVHDHHHCHCASFAFKRISWTAIFVGALVGVGLSFLLNVFAVAIGLSAVTVNSSGATVIAIGGILGLLIGLIAAMIVAGYAAGYLGRHYCPQRNLGIVYGFTTWSLAIVLSAFVASGMGHYAAGYAKAVLGSNTVISMYHDNEPVSIKTHSMSHAVVEENNGKSTATPVTTVNVTPNTMVGGAFILFVLFFVGAIACCFGACWAMTCTRED